MTSSAYSSSLWRSNINEKKSTRYFSTHGQGRDGYILNLNTVGEGIGEGNTFRMSSQPCEKPTHLDKTVKYFSDGKGRDTYILHNSGGMFSPESAGAGINTRQLFISSLRHYNAQKMGPSFIKISPKDLLLAKRQRQLSKNLSQPRFCEQIYSHLSTPRQSTSQRSMLEHKFNYSSNQQSQTYQSNGSSPMSQKILSLQNQNSPKQMSIFKNNNFLQQEQPFSPRNYHSRLPSLPNQRNQQYGQPLTAK